MTRSLVIKCPKCGKTREVLNLQRTAAVDIGRAVERADADGLDLELAEGPLEVGCGCVEASQLNKGIGARRDRFQFSVRQVLLVVTTVAVLLTVFRHPISLIFDDRVLRWAAAPWSVYGWLFFGTEIIDPRPSGKLPMGIIMLLVNMAAATMLPIAIVSAAAAGFKRLWQMAK